MLVLTRRIGERIIIDNHIVLEVLEIKGHRIRLGIQAPQSVSVLRQELMPQPIEVEVEAQHPPFGDYSGTP